MSSLKVNKVGNSLEVDLLVLLGSFQEGEMTQKSKYLTLVR